MALSTPSYKSVGVIIAIALVGVIVVIATVNIQNRQSGESTQTTKPFLEPDSGVVFDGPIDWTVGKTSASTLEVRTARIGDVRAQRTTCIVASNELTRSMRSLLSTGAAGATAAWQQQYPGLVTSQILKGPTTLFSIVGIDTCNPSLTVRSLTFRAQVYKNDVEVAISRQIPQSSELSPTELKGIAESLADGTAADDLQAQFNQFVDALGSVR